MPAPRPEEILDVFDPWTLPAEEDSPQASAPETVALESVGQPEPEQKKSAWSPPSLPPAATEAASASALSVIVGPEPARPTGSSSPEGEDEGPTDVEETAAEATDEPLHGPEPEPDVRFTDEGALEPGVVVPASTSTPHRWRKRVPSPREKLVPQAPPPDPSTNPTEFLRRVVVPEFQDLAKRLEAAQHYTTVQDLLDLPTPAVRVLIWPRPGLLDHQSARILATFELLLEEDEPQRVRTSYWLGARPEDVVPMAEVSVEQFTHEWVRTQTLDFVQKVLDQA